jgi:hypothetical protein
MPPGGLCIGQRRALWSMFPSLKEGGIMITAIVRFKLAPGEDRESAIEEIKKTIPLYQRAAPALIRKQISIDADKGEGCSVYLWRDQESAERFFEMAKTNIKAKTGQEPQIEYLSCDVLVDNKSGEVVFGGS